VYAVSTRKRCRMEDKSLCCAGCKNTLSDREIMYCTKDNGKRLIRDRYLTVCDDYKTAGPTTKVYANERT
jgi:hypothetical protein